jgi:hypothetical protein
MVERESVLDLIKSTPLVLDAPSFQHFVEGYDPSNLHRLGLAAPFGTGLVSGRHQSFESLLDREGSVFLGNLAQHLALQTIE